MKIFGSYEGHRSHRENLAVVRITTTAAPRPTARKRALDDVLDPRVDGERDVRACFGGSFRTSPFDHAL
jgi:hypothetical protein